MKEIFKNLFDSLNNKSDGWSGKKLTALCITICVLATHIKWITMGDFSQLVSVLTVDFSFLSVLFGINVYDKKQNGQPASEPK